MRGYVKRRFLVGGLQYRLLGVSALHFLFVVVIFALTLFVPVFIRLGSGSGYDPEVTRAAHEFMALHTRVWPALSLAFMLLLLHDVLVSHRIAGPLYRLRREFEAIGRGDLSRQIRVRKSDYIQNEAAGIDVMVTRLRCRVKAIKDANQAATAAVSEMERAAEAGSRERFHSALRAVREDLSGAAAELETFICSTDEALARTRTSTEPEETPQAAREPEPVA